MSKRISLLSAALLIISVAAIVSAQTQPQTQTQPTTTVVTQTPTTTVTQTPTTVTKTVQNPDGTFTVIEYPLKKETIVTLNPVTITNAKGTATILRDDNGTRVVLDMTGVPADVAAMNLYAVDHAGVVTSLGPVVLSNGTGKFSGTTPLTKFMLVAAPDENLTAYDANSKVFFRSAVPEGFAVIPHTQNPVGETVGATTTPGTTAASISTVPMLNIPAYKKGDDTKLKIDFTGPMAGARANVFIEPHKNGAETEVKMRFHELKEAPTGKVYILWAVSPDNQFSKLGEIANVKGRNEAEIKANTTLSDFGLLVTMEDLGAVKTIVTPVGVRLGVIQIVP
ncbi:MAG TPA: hypothetical protein VMZ30_12810 [Pyrinomonadaceae bacterium]|nr:hypothetical protein [Pyrinomonadaceae bacterium]